MKRTRLKAIVAASMLLAGTAFATTTSTTFEVTATVVDGCVISATNHDFGVYTPSSPADNINGVNTITATCTMSTLYDIGLDAGTGTGATAASRKMTRVGGTETLEYSLYHTADRLVVLGNTLGADVISGVGTGVAVDHTVFGTIPAGQNVPSGSYTDTITATIDF